MGAASLDKQIESKRQETYGTNDFLSRTGKKRRVETSGDGRYVLIVPSLLPSPNTGSGQR
jgi:hypothetical protein